MGRLSKVKPMLPSRFGEHSLFFDGSGIDSQRMDAWPEVPITNQSVMPANDTDRSSGQSHQGHGSETPPTRSQNIPAPPDNNFDAARGSIATGPARIEENHPIPVEMPDVQGSQPLEAFGEGHPPDASARLRNSIKEKPDSSRSPHIRSSVSLRREPSQASATQSVELAASKRFDEDQEDHRDSGSVTSIALPPDGELRPQPDRGLRPESMEWEGSERIRPGETRWSPATPNDSPEEGGDHFSSQSGRQSRLRMADRMPQRRQIADQSPNIEISIGCIEIKAVVDPPSAPKKTKPKSALLPLDAYLKKRTNESGPLY